MSMKNLKVLSIVCAIGVILVFSMPSYAALGKIAGTVTNQETGEPLPGAQIQVVGTTMGAAANAQGQYFILNVPPGNYTLRVTFMGFATEEVKDVRVQLDATTKVDFKMKETVIEGETISIVAERPPVDKTMTATKVIFAEEVVNNVLPVNTLNEILQTSVTTQSMRGANKVGVAYMIDGVNITDIMFAAGGGTDGYTNVKRNPNPLGSTTTGEFNSESNLDVRGRSAEMVQTAVGIDQSTVAEANVIAGTFNAEYSASAGVINIASKSGGKTYSGKLFVRSSLGGLDHAGPDCYNAVVAEGKTAADLYMAHKQALINGGNTALAALMTWEPGKYEYGEKPRITSEFSFGGPMTSKGNFFFAGNFLNDHGRFPGEFQRQLGLSLKLNYDVTGSDRLTLFGKVDDWGQLLGWTNRSYSYVYQFWLEGQPVWDRMGLASYLKHTHVFNPASFLETTISYVGNERTWGYKPVDDKLQYDKYGDWLILDTKEKADKYLNDPNTRIFNTAPGNDPNYQVTGFQNQIRFGLAGYHYENLKTSTLTLASNYTNQVSFHHQLKAGLEYKLHNIDRFSHKSSVGFPDPSFKFETVIYDINPWSFGSFVQDKIEFEGIIVNLGARFDAYNLDTKFWDNFFAPVKWDTFANGQAVNVWNATKKSKTHYYVSPRIGISHPITENAAMHYSWGIYTTQPNLGYWLQNYGSFANVSLPAVWNSDPDPEKATAYEIGVNMAITNDFGVDLTAYYRDVRNGTAIGYSINQDKSLTKTDFSLYTYYTNWGYRDSRGLELNFWKRPTPQRYFGVFGLSGNLSISYAYDKSSISGAGINQDAAFTTSLSYNNATKDYDWDVVYIWPTYSRGYNDWKGKLSLLWDFPFDVKLSTIATYKSPWRYQKKLNVTNLRYEEMLMGEYFFQVDMRLTKYVKVAGIRGGLFFEMLNVFNRENILTFDNYGDSNLYELNKNPWGILNRPVDQYGSPLAGIAREMYVGFEVSF
ncbi:MAG: carboxypeptidase-like regulatory domain-containing protein [candidate division KSB1 bacterium]|nr:carboxypeptidase-like regulatory domain-containing protein [candidate division KSB1 bacterium]